MTQKQNNYGERKVELYLLSPLQNHVYLGEFDFSSHSHSHVLSSMFCSTLSWFPHNMHPSFQPVNPPAMNHSLHVNSSMKWIHCPVKRVNTTLASVVAPHRPESLTGNLGTMFRNSYIAVVLEEGWRATGILFNLSSVWRCYLLDYEPLSPFQRDTNMHNLFNELRVVRWMEKSGSQFFSLRVWPQKNVGALFIHSTNYMDVRHCSCP